MAQALDQHRLLEAGASRSITARVASGVTSSAVRPVPPVVKTKRTSSATQRAQAASIAARVVGQHLDGGLAAGGLRSSSASRGAGAVLALAAGERRRDREDGGTHQAGTVPARGP